jgi:hypothetical protein
MLKLMLGATDTCGRGGLAASQRSERDLRRFNFPKCIGDASVRSGLENIQILRISQLGSSH